MTNNAQQLASHTFICSVTNSFNTQYKKAITQAFTDYPTLCLIQVELGIPSGAIQRAGDVLRRFAHHLQDKINIERTSQLHKCDARFVWELKEDKCNLTLILNREAYPEITNHSSGINFITKSLETSWTRAFNCQLSALRGKVYYPKHAVSYLRIKD